MRAVVDGFEIQFDSFEDFESWYAENGHRLPEEPQLFYEDEEGNEMARVLENGEWEDYHTIDGVAVSEEDWEEHINYSGSDEDYQEIIEFDDDLPF